MKAAGYEFAILRIGYRGYGEEGTLNADEKFEQITQNAKVFCKEIEEAGYDAMIYSNMLWEAYELDLEKLLDYPVWYADYEELPQTPYRFSMWQYSSKGSVPGIEGNVDLNIQLLKK